MKKNKNQKKLLSEILRNTLIGVIVTFAYYPELISKSFSLIAFLKKGAFIMIVVNIPTFIKMFVGESKTNKSDERIYDGRSAKELTLKEKLEVAKDLKESYTVTVSWKQWAFIIGSTVFTSWYFLHNQENPSAENIFTSVFLGLFFSVVLVGLAKIIQDEKDKKSKSE